MALELYQEVIPFTNEKTRYPVSKDASFSNPVVMPLSFDVTSVYNTVETVIYIRNNNKDKYFTNVAVMLMAPRESFNDPDVNSSYSISSITVDENGIATIKDQANADRFLLDMEYTTEMPPAQLPGFDITTWFDGANSAFLPVSSQINGNDYRLNQVTSPLLDVRFSYGYDEVSELDWSNKKHGIIIPNLGTSGMSDISFVPIRMRMWLNGSGSLYTLRNYSINLCYTVESDVA